MSDHHYSSDENRPDDMRSAGYHSEGSKEDGTLAHRERLKTRERIKELRGELRWGGDLEEMHHSRFFAPTE